MKVRTMTALLLCGLVLSTSTLTVNGHAEENKPEGRAIIGKDERVRIMDTTKAPYSSIAFLSAGRVYGSSTVIGKNKLLTAGHVVENVKTSWDISQVKVYPGRNGYVKPFGSFDIESIDIHKYWSIGENRDFDIAVVTVKPNSNGQHIGEVVPIVPVKDVANFPVGTRVSVPGYSEDKIGELWEGTGSVLSQTTYGLYYNADTLPGTSGAPIYNEKKELIGVNTSHSSFSGPGAYNSGSIITGSNHEFIEKHLDKKETDTQAPSQVSGLKASAITTNSAQLSWNPSTDNVGVDKYEVYRNGSKIGESKTASFTANGLSADTSYTFSVVAVDKAGNRSTASAGLAIRTGKELIVDTQAPSQVTGVKASNITSTSAQVSWNPSTDNVGVDKYEIYRNGLRIGESRSTTFELNGLTANTSYTISVAALDKAGNRSVLSAGLALKTAKEPEKPSGNQTTWIQSKVYVAGNNVFYNGIEYKAKWWTQGNQPGRSDVWEKLSTGIIEEWNSNLAYSGGNIISYKGTKYKAKWWTRGEEPGKAPVWEKSN
ncbi:fibronectin type III domain-containing protein [Candidatus Enterococcus mansonii]|uniref:Serine protease n=1 Tax=Candidatus Enterococcus mansonii TaxID=1834181 RepID=A0A242C652_9ENTE|nr:fibronectin type III domain-containing protein [Enterococcus sp. 4G2_DIV0659]OTO05588.1 hypothetical protein A5880_002761 [Enterococcus sp. 4G2_DIV0659]